MVSRQYSTAPLLAALDRRGARMRGGARRLRDSAVRAGERRHSAEVQDRSREADDRSRSETRRRDAAARLELRPARRHHDAAGHLLRGWRHGALREDVLPAQFFDARQVAGRRGGPRHQCASIGIEKYAARFADRGLVAMAIDYQSYGFSGSGSDDLRLLEPDTTTDDRPVTEKTARLLLKRTNLNNVHEVADFRAAVSFLQGEPGVDPGSHRHLGIEQRRRRRDRGGWRRCARQGRGRAGLHAAPRRAARRSTSRRPTSRTRSSRVRQGQGAEVDGGFSFRSKIDQWSNTAQSGRAGRRVARSDRRRRPPCCSCRPRRTS